jgi:predicted transcriptional regulator
MQHEALLLSVRPAFVQRILEGTKTAELRRVRPTARVGQRVLIYSTSPTMALLASAVVEGVESGSPVGMWDRVRRKAGVSREEYLRYFASAEMASAIWLSEITPFERPLSLSQLRERWPWFRPPQSYCFVRATFEQPWGVTSLSPRWG